MNAVYQSPKFYLTSDQGLGEYTVQASVPSPVVNVLCAGMNIDEMAPMVYTKWTSFNGTVPNGTNW